MANVTVTANMTTLSLCESTSGWSGLSDLDSDLKKQGSNSISGVVTGTGIDDDATYDYGSAINLTSQHVRLWLLTSAISYLANESSGGIALYLEDTSGNKSYWNIAGKDTYQGGWLNVVVYTGNTPDTTSGTLDLTNVRYIGLSFNKASRPKNVTNTWVDYVRYGDGIDCESSSTTDFTMDDIYIEDNANGYGIVEKINGVYFINGSITFTSDSNSLYFSDDGSVIVFADKGVSSTLYKIDTDFTQTSNKVQFLNGIIASFSKPFDMTFTTVDNSASKIENCTIKAPDTNSTLTITNGSMDLLNSVIQNMIVSVTGNTLSGCSLIAGSGITSHILLLTPSATFENCTLNVTECTPIRVATVGTYDFDNITFIGTNGTSYYDIGNYSSGAIEIDVSNGGNVSYVYNDGTGSHTINNPITFTLTGVVNGSELRIYKTSDKSELSGTESITGNEHSFGYNYTGDVSAYVVILNVDYVPIKLDVTLSSTNTSIPIQQRIDRWYYDAT